MEASVDLSEQSLEQLARAFAGVHPYQNEAVGFGPQEAIALFERHGLGPADPASQVVAHFSSTFEYALDRLREANGTSALGPVITELLDQRRYMRLGRSVDGLARDLNRYLAYDGLILQPDASGLYRLNSSATRGSEGDSPRRRVTAGNPALWASLIGLVVALASLLLQVWPRLRLSRVDWSLGSATVSLLNTKVLAGAHWQWGDVVLGVATGLVSSAVFYALVSARRSRASGRSA